MTNPISSIRQSLARKISLGILLGALVVFVVAIGILSAKSLQKVREESIAHAERLLEVTALRVEGIMDEVEVATHNMEKMVMNHLQPDSLLAFTERMVELNPDINSCSITTEPFFFPQYGRYFSAYSVRQDDSLITVREGEYEYFDKVWYKSAHDEGHAVWVEPYDDYNEGTLYSKDMIASYSLPLYTDSGSFIGVISTDISLPRLSLLISAEKPFPDSYSIMLGKEGNYYVHPDTSRLVKTTIFDEEDPERQPALIALGHEMIAGNKGVLNVKANGETYISLYEPIERAGWSIALICTESDIFDGYRQLSYFVIILLVIGLSLLMFYCRRAVTHFIAPVKELSAQARNIADGNYDNHMPRTTRPDIVGRLQNDFADMQNTLADHMAKLKAINEATAERNQELAKVNQEVVEAAHQKTAFLQDMTHQIRTPLNVIMGFVQVLRDDFNMIHSEEAEGIVNTMRKNAISVSRMANMLVAAAAVADGRQKAECRNRVGVEEVANKLANMLNQLHLYDVPIVVESHVDKDMQILTNRDYFEKVLNELLYNAKKYTNEGTITLRLEKGGSVVRFIVEDTGPGIPKEAHDSLFKDFRKLNDFNEGLGLGLSISQKFARMIGGNIFLDTNYTTGARFVFEVPLMKEGKGGH